MSKNQLQELAQRSCFNLPSYACTREGLDHAPRFKASVNFNGEIFESPSYFNTLRQAEHSAAQVALSVLSTRGPSRSLTTRVLDETGVYKNLLQETAHRGGLKLPVYTTVRSGPGHAPVFTSTVEIAAMNFTGESAKTKKQAEKNAAIAAWSALKKLPNLGSLSQPIKEAKNREEEDGSKQVWRDQKNQTRRRMVKGHGDNNIGTSNYHQQWRYLDLLLDSASDGLLSSTKSSLFEQTHIRSRLLGSATPSPRALSPIKTPSMCSRYTGGYNNLPQRIAPAVQIRSVIPVCATPPLPVRPSPSNPPSSVIQAASSASSATSMSNNPESYSSKFSSMFNNKLQL